jgi:predicted transcriptional regulator
MTYKRGTNEETSAHVTYRDPIYIRKDILMKLYEYGELNKSKLVSYCNLNNNKHKQIIHDFVQKGMIKKSVEKWGSKVVIKYSLSERGKRFLREIMLPYEELFPRKSGNLNSINSIMSKRQKGI